MTYNVKLIIHGEVTVPVNTDNIFIIEELARQQVVVPQGVRVRVAEIEQVEQAESVLAQAAASL